MQHLRAEEGKYWTGYVFPDDVNWPAEHTTYTAAAVILAVDALTHSSAGADIMRGTTLAADFAEIALECGCESADRGRPHLLTSAPAPASSPAPPPR